MPTDRDWHRRNPYRSCRSVSLGSHTVDGFADHRDMTPTEPDVPNPNTVPYNRDWTPTELAEEPTIRLDPSPSTDMMRTATVPAVLSKLGNLCLSVFEAKEENLGIMQERATAAGLYTDCVPTPDNVPNKSGNTWLVAGVSPRRVAEVCRAIKQLSGGSVSQTKEAEAPPVAGAATAVHREVIIHREQPFTAGAVFVAFCFLLSTYFIYLTSLRK